MHLHHPPFPQQHMFPSAHQAPPMMHAAMGGREAIVGRTLGTHKGRLELRDIMPVGGVLLVLLGLGGGAATIPDIVSGAESVTSLGFVPICVALGALLLWRTIRQMQQTLDVCERGFVYRIGGKEQIVPWVDVTGQRAIRVIGSNGLEKGFRLILALRDGRQITLTTWLENVHGLYGHVASFIPCF
jgi:hypothetical protein